MIHYLPKEIIVEVLLKVPAKDLFRSRTVCKLWYSIISNPDFVEAHAALAQPSVFFTTYRERDRFYCIDDIDSNKEESNVIRSGELLLRIGLNKVRDTCRGLLLVQLFRRGPVQLYICNPVTRCVQKLPSSNKAIYYDWTLVYLDSVKKYKVFGMSPMLQNPGLVLTVGNGSVWREFAAITPFVGCKACEPISQSIFFAQEKESHWLVRLFSSSSFDKEKAIYTIDVEEEQARCTVMPSYVPKECSILAKVGGSLCVMSGIGNGATEINVWVLEDKLDFKWTQTYTIGISAPPLLKSMGRDWRDCTFSMTNNCASFAGLAKILFNHEEKLFRYDLLSLELRQVGMLELHDERLTEQLIMGPRNGVYWSLFSSLLSWE